MSSFRLDGLVAGGGEWEAGNRLVVDKGNVGLSRVGTVGTSRIASLPIGSLTEVKAGTLAELNEDMATGIDERAALEAVGAEHADGRALVLRFLDPERGTASWVFAGPAARIEKAQTALSESRSVPPIRSAAAAKAERLSESQVPLPDEVPKVSGSHRAIVLAVALAIVALIAAIAVLGVRLSSSDIDLPSLPEQDSSQAEDAQEPQEAQPPQADVDVDVDAESGGSFDVRGPYQAGGLVAIERQVAEEVGRPRPRYVLILASADYAQFTILKSADSADQYTWRDGRVTGPAPARVSGVTGDPSELSFTRGDVRLGALPGLTRRASRVDLGGNTELSTTVIQRGIPFVQNVRFLVNITGDRQNGQLRANARGKVTEILKS